MDGRTLTVVITYGVVNKSRKQEGCVAVPTSRLLQCYFKR